MDSLAFSDYKRLCEFSRDKALTQGDNKTLKDNGSKMNILIKLRFPKSGESQNFFVLNDVF